MLPEEYEALSWMDKSKLNISKFGQGLKVKAVNGYNIATNYCYDSAKIGGMNMKRQSKFP